MRSKSDSTAMQVVFLLVVLSFVGWGVGSNGNQAGTVATVNGEPISDLDFREAYRQAELSRRSDAALTDDQRQALREEVVQDLVRRTALLQEASRLGLEVSSKEIAEVLLQDKYLQDDQGKFDRRAYENYLRQRGTTRANHEERLRQELLVRKLQGLMILGASVSDAAVKQRYVDANTKLDVQFVRIRPAQFAASIQPTDEQVAKYLADHGDEVRARYDEDFAAKYDLPETVDLRLIRLAVRDDGLGVAELKGRVEGIKAELESGGDFDAVARRVSEDPSAAEGGLVKGAKLTDLDEALKGAVGKLQPGQLGEVLVSDTEVRLVRLETRTPARQVPFDEVKADLAKAKLVEAEAPAQAAAFAEKELLPAWTAAKAAPEALLAGKGLEVASTGLTTADGGGLLRPPQKMMDAARTAAIGAVLPEVYEEDGVLWVGALTAREDADLTKFEAEKAQIREQALLSRRFEFFQAWVDDVVARAKVER